MTEEIKALIRELIPRKRRKYATKLIDTYLEHVPTNDYKNWDEYLKFMYVGITDGWIDTNNNEYQALLFLVRMNNFIELLKSTGKAEVRE